MNQTNTTAPAKKSSELAVIVAERQAAISASQHEIEKMLPRGIPADKFVRTALTAVRMQPDIARCTSASILNSCMKAAADGLVLDGREATLAAFNSKKKLPDGKEDWVSEAQYIPMVQGIIKRVRNSGEVSIFNAFVVFENDAFEVTYGMDMNLYHKPNFDNPGLPIGAYASATFKDGGKDFEYMPRRKIMAIAKRGKNAAKYMPPTSYNEETGEHVGGGIDFEEWWRKTAIRRLSKRLPMSGDMARVIETIERDFGEDAPQAPAQSAPQYYGDDSGNTIDGETGEVMEPKKRGRRSKAEVEADLKKQMEAEKPPVTPQPQAPVPQTAHQSEPDITDRPIMPHLQERASIPMDTPHPAQRHSAPAPQAENPPPFLRHNQQAPTYEAEYSDMDAGQSEIDDII